MKVYILFENNGQSYEDNSYSVVGVYEHKEYAEYMAYLFNNSRNSPLLMSEDEFIKSDENDGSLTYQEYIEYEKQSWDYSERPKYQYIEEFELITNR